MVKAEPTAADAPQVRCDGGSRLPCLNSNNSNEPTLTGGQKRTAFALATNVKLMADEYGIQNLGFLTLTFRDHVVEISEAQRRFNSLRAGVLSERYRDFIVVVERQKSQRIHFHLLVVLAGDVRTGFDFAAIARHEYQSANTYLRSEWSFWRRTSPEYGFGRTELMPIHSTSEGISKYLGKYIAKHIDRRVEADKGARLVRYSEGARRCGTRFAWTGPNSKKWRLQLASFATRHGCWSMDMLRERFGPKWAYHLADRIAEEVLVAPQVP
jgi:hypothetical protein